MALEDLEPSFEEKWRARILGGLGAVVTFLGLLWFHGAFLTRNLFLGLGCAPLIHYGAFQLVSKLTTGRAFAVRLSPQATRPEEVFDLLFSVAYLFTLLVTCVITYDAVMSAPPVMDVRVG